LTVLIVCCQNIQSMCCWLRRCWRRFWCWREEVWHWRAV